MSAFTPRGSNPFTPGIGETPPCVAGREEEMAELNGYLHRLHEEGKGKVAVIFAPRGNGKTVLLRWLKRECEAAGVHAVSATPGADDRICTAELQKLLPPDTAPDTSQVSVGGGVNLGAAAFTAQWTEGQTKKTGLFKDHLKEACKQAPRALLVDEAHQWIGDDRRPLLNTIQEVIDERPLLVVIAGTPGMMPIINKGVTFINRVPKLCPGLLALDAAIDAIRIPLSAGGIAITDTAIEQVANDAQRYPFFLQVWGKALWDHAAKQSVQRLADEHMQAAKAGVEKVRISFYGDRFKEIRPDPALFAAGVALADAYKNAGQFDEQGIAELISLALQAQIPELAERGKQAEALLTELVSLGYIWEPAGSLLLQPGIPSLMDFVAQRRAKHHLPVPATDILRITRETCERQGLTHAEAPPA